MIDKLSFLRGVSDGGGTSADEERLMQLFQNRAGLKKAYADLKDEFHLLRDRLKQQTGATSRVQEQLDALGDLLADPVTGYGALVFYQLRGLWRLCHRQLSAFCGELVRVQETRELTKYRADCDGARALRLAEVDERIAAATRTADAEHGALQNAQRELGALTAFWHYFERRRRQRSLGALELRASAADAALEVLKAERAATSQQADPDFPGLSLAARRNINLAIIGYAELLCEIVDGFGLAARAKEAVARRVHEMNFGHRAECEEFMQRVQKAQAAVTGQKQVNSAVKSKLDRLRAGCDYRNSADSVPTADSIGAADGNGVSPRPAAAPPWNVLAEDYWDLYTLMLR